MLFQGTAMPEPGLTVFSPPSRPAVNPAPAAPVRVPSAAAGTVASSPPQSEPEKRWAADRAKAAEGDPWQHDPSRTMMVKDADGTVRAVPRTDGGVNGVPQAEGQPQPQPGPAAVVDGKLVVGDLSLSADDIKSILAEKAARDSRAANRPADAGGYSLDLPSDFELPPGVAGWRWNLDDPTTAALLGQAKEWAFAHRLDQPAFSGLLGLYVANQIADQQRFDAARKAEIGKLGSAVATRVDAVNTWLESQLGSELAGALRKTMFTADAVRGYERLMRNYVSQGVYGNPAGGRDGAGSQPERLSDEAYARLSYAEKQEYASRFDQRQFGGG
jgi:hypothetical protein